jgi:putative nucleotidyltransferase with HDIG domain
VSGLSNDGRSLLGQTPSEGFDGRAFADLLPRLAPYADAIEDGLRSLAAEHYPASPSDVSRAVGGDSRATEFEVVDAMGGATRLPASALVPLSPDSEALGAALAPALQGLEPEAADLALAGIALELSPAVELHPEHTRESADQAAQAVSAVRREVAAGSLILAVGSEVTRQHLEDVGAERAAYRESPRGRLAPFQRQAGVLVLLAIIMGAFVLYARRYRPELVRQRSLLASFIVLTLILVGTARFCVVWGLTPLWIPLPLMVMVLCLVYNQRFALGVTMFYALLIRLAYPGADFASFVLLIGGIVAGLASGQVRTRSTLIKAGLLTGFAQFAAVWGLGLLSVPDARTIPLQFWESPLMSMSAVALVNAVLSGFVVSGLLPAIEGVFGVTTDIRLLEWSDPNQPLLQRLLLDAPGSYHHSMVVGSLAADAAEAIGANPLLARVSAYFHDVGKLKKPEYFGENLSEGEENPHEALSPTMSSLIITAHPKDGAEMAEQYGVPRAVRDIILQSHGCSLLKYFWGKAKESEGEPGEAKEHSFRYRLPRPECKEAAIVMLCDAAESAARSMKSPTVVQLRTLVHDLIMDRLHDGQLDRSGLTITDLRDLEDTIVRGLTAVFHSRVTYPGQDEGGQEATGLASASSEQKGQQGEEDAD